MSNPEIKLNVNKNQLIKKNVVNWHLQEGVHKYLTLCSGTISTSK